MTKAKKTATDSTPSTPEAKKLRETLNTIVRKEVEKIPELLEELPPPERVRAVLDLLQYCAPKLDKAPHDYDQPRDGTGWEPFPFQGF